MEYFLKTRQWYGDDEALAAVTSDRPLNAWNTFATDSYVSELINTTFEDSKYEYSLGVYKNGDKTTARLLDVPHPTRMQLIMFYENNPRLYELHRKNAAENGYTIKVMKVEKRAEVRKEVDERALEDFWSLALINEHCQLEHIE